MNASKVEFCSYSKGEDMLLYNLYDFLLSLHTLYWTSDRIYKKELAKITKLSRLDFDYIFSNLHKSKFFIYEPYNTIKIFPFRIVRIGEILKACQNGDFEPLRQFAYEYGFLTKGGDKNA